MSTKQISINLSSLSAHSNSHKTRKNVRPKEKPIISPNVLKNKLLNRIKEHKKRESNSLTKPNNNSNILAYSDEFNESMDYLENLSKQTQKEKKREELQRQTLKNHSVTTPMLNVYNDLPEDLIDINKAFVSSVCPTLTSDTVPYGILKNGSKPTFREWKKTQKNVSSFSPSPTMNEREKRMADLKSKLASMSSPLQQSSMPSALQSLSSASQQSSMPSALQSLSSASQQSSMSSPLQSSMPLQSLPSALQSLPSASQQSSMPSSLQSSMPFTSSLSEPSVVPSQTPVPSQTTSADPPSSYVSKKYTLGKKHNVVGVLLKDSKTRKNVMTAHQNLKKKSISQIKEYLKDHNLIKVGSTAPQDVLKEMYVSAMLTGEVTNSNQDILLHNFLKSEENK